MMSRHAKMTAIYTVILIVLGVLLNRLGSRLVAAFELPLYLDSIGTMVVAAVGGLAPGTLVGFVTNMIAGFQDSSSFYYGIINVLIALIAGMAYERGWFDKPYKILFIIPYFMILSIPCSFLSYILFNFDIADNASAPATLALKNMGLPIILSQIIGDYAVEIPDKLLSLIVAFIIIKLIPEKIKDIFIPVAGRDMSYDIPKTMKKWISLRSQVVLVLFMSGLGIALVAFAISYKTYMEARVSGFPGQYDIDELRTETLLYCSKMFSAILGLLICIVAWSMVLANRRVVRPLNSMAKEMGRFAYDSAEGRDNSVEKIKSLKINTGNEIEELYLAISKTVSDIDDYIDKTNEQARTISELNVNIVTALADIVEGRDETTGNHVKRTAEYCMILARTLRSQGKFTEMIDDEYINIIGIAAPLHDIGKINIPDAILNKPGRLTDEEFEIIKTHTISGKNMIDNIIKTMGSTEYLRMARNIAAYHHEWFDGSMKGYPDGLKGKSIPLSARIMAVADVFDALVSKRPYKDGFSVDKAFEIMLSESGTHFDPDVINAMVESRSEFEKIKAKY